MHRGGPGKPRPRVGRAGTGRTFPRRVPPPPVWAAAERAGASLRGRPLPGRVTSRTPREPWRSYAKNVRAEPGGWHLPGPRSRRQHPVGRRRKGRPRPRTAPPRPRPAPPPAERGRHGNGITGAECCLFSAECQEIRRGGCQAHLPGVGGGRRRRGWTSAPGASVGRERGRESFVTGGH